MVVCPLSLRYPSVNSRGRNKEDGTDVTDGQMFLKLIRARICVYILEKICHICPRQL